MAFLNEYIPEADYEKYDLRRVCREHNLPSRRDDMHSDHWTIDRERDAFLIKVWAHHESEFFGYAFYWRGEWMFFEISPVEGKKDPATSTCWFRYRVKGVAVPSSLELRREEVLSDLQAAITACAGSPTSNYANSSATIEFIGE